MKRITCILFWFCNLALCQIPTKAIPRCADISLNGVYFEDSRSAIKILKPDHALYSIDFEGYDYTNKTRSEWLRIFFHPGNTRNCFSEFEVKYTSMSFDNKQSSRLSTIRSFKTGKGIHLGLASDSLLVILGKKHCVISREKNKTIIKYALDEMQASPFLRFYNTPSYYGKYIFKDGKLVEFAFGFEYP